MSIPTSVYAEMTPNPAVMKFVADRPLIAEQFQAEFRSKEEASWCSPLAEELFNFPFVQAVFISGAFVSVSKDESLGWEMIVQQLREYIREWLMEHEFMGLEGQEIPEMPEAFVQEVSDRYIDLFERVTGQAFKRLPLEHLEKDIELAVNQWIKDH